MKTAQETFDTVVTHLAGMTHRSMVGETCVYRAPDGNKCAVGCLITDNEYQKKLEGLPVRHIINVQSDVMPVFADDYACHKDMLARLQDIHDQLDYWTGNREDMKNQLRGVARQYEVSPDIIDNLTWEKVKEAA